MGGSNTGRLRPHGMVAALFVLALGITEAAFGTVTVGYNSPWRGGDISSGLLFHQAICGGQRTLVGITGRSGTFVDTVNGAVCVGVMPDGKWIGQPSVESKVSNAAGGSAFTLQCPANHALVGIEGREGAIVDALAIKCGPLSQAADGALVAGAASSTQGPVGGSGGTPFSDSCPSGKLAWYVDSWWGTRGDFHNVAHMVRMGCEAPRVANYYPAKSSALSKDMVTPGESATFTFTLDGPAARGQNATLHVPSYVVPSGFTASPGWNVTIPGGQTSMSVTITATANAQPGSWIELKPSWGSQPVLSGDVLRRRLSVVAANTPIVQSVTLIPSTLWEGESATLTTTLAAPAAALGTSVEITKQCCGGTFAGPVTSGINGLLHVQPGQTSVSQTVTNAQFMTGVTTSSSTGTVLAKASVSGDTGKTFQFTVKANAVKEVSIIRNSKDPAAPISGKVVLEAPGRAQGRTVNLVSSNPSAVQVPATVTISATSTSATFPLTILDPTIAASTRPGVIVSASISGAGSTIVRKVRVADGAAIP